MLRRLLAIAAVAAQLCGAAAFAQPEAPRPIPLEAFLKRTEFRDVQLSPSGRWLAAISPSRGRYNLAVIDLDTRQAKVITSFDDRDVLRFSWITDTRVIFAIGDMMEASGEARYRGRFIVDLDGSNPRRVDNIPGFQILASHTDHPDEIVVAANRRTATSADVYRYNIRTGRTTEMLTFDSPGHVMSWVLDRDYVPRVAYTREEGRRQLWYRDSMKAAWRRFPDDKTDAERFRPVAFDSDGKTMYVSAAPANDRLAIYKWDWEKNALGELVAAHPEADVYGLLFDGRRNKLLGYRAVGDKPFIRWFDPDVERTQKAVDEALPNTFNTLDWAADAPNRMLVFAWSDRDPGTYYLFNAEKRELERLFSVASWIRPDALLPRKPVRYKARDGMEIPAYLTLPRNAEGRKVPLIVNVHGGPNVRGATWGYDPTEQMLAAEGYAVLSPNFRGTTGLGRKLYEAGFKQWGLAMQDDLVDGAQWLIDQGIVDPRRICIVGGSYGGYAVLYGVARDPDFWRCGVAYVAVSDIGLLFDVTWSDTARSPYRFLDYEAKWRIGDPDKDAEQFRKTSAVENAARIKAPLLLAYGSDDVRVPLIHGTKMRAALDRNGKPYEWVVYTGEGHGFNKDENRLDFSRRMLAFLKKHLE